VVKESQHNKTKATVEIKIEIIYRTHMDMLHDTGQQRMKFFHGLTCGFGRCTSICNHRGATRPVRRLNEGMSYGRIRERGQVECGGEMGNGRDHETFKMTCNGLMVSLLAN
jgi:hypothetical protein